MLKILADMASATALMLANRVPVLKEKTMTPAKKSREKMMVKMFLRFMRAVSMATNKPARPPTPRGIRGARKTVRMSTGQKAGDRYAPMRIWQQTPADRTTPALMSSSS